MLSLPPVSHLLYELGAYVLLLACLWHARRQGRSVFFTLLAGVLYGILIEYMGLSLKTSTGQEYHYGQFLIVLFRGGPTALPLCIPTGWGLIFYAVLQTTKKLGSLPLAARPFLNATLAVSLDLVMDPVASGTNGLGMWVWGSNTDTIWWMGVPVSNFIGWYTVLTTFSFILLLGLRLVPAGSKGFWGDLGVPLAAVFLGLLSNSIILLGFERFIWEKPVEPWFLIGLLAAGAVIFIRYVQRFKRNNPVDWVVLAVPLFFQFYFFIWLFLAGTYRALPGMIALAPIIIVAGLTVYLWPYRHLLTLKRTGPIRS